jgi:hypothetical protein
MKKRNYSDASTNWATPAYCKQVARIELATSRVYVFLRHSPLWFQVSKKDAMTRDDETIDALCQAELRPPTILLLASKVLAYQAAPPVTQWSRWDSNPRPRVYKTM